MQFDEHAFVAIVRAEENDARFIVKDANGQALAYVYFERDPRRRAGPYSAFLPKTTPVCGFT